MTIEKVEFIPDRANDDKPRVLIWDEEKFNHKFEVKPAIGGWVFYVVGVTDGPVPQKLSGKYSRMSYAVKAVEDYINDAKPTKSVKRDQWNKAREKRKNAAERQGTAV